MKRVLVLVVCAVLFGTAAQAAQFGLGISAKSNDSAIYLPVVFGKLMLEPYVNWYEYENNDADRRYDFEGTEIGLGVFGLYTITDSILFHYGTRIGYVEEESKQKDSFNRFSEEIDGYTIAPTIGFEYFFMRQISIGGEAEWFYSKLDGEAKRSFTSDSDVEFRNKGTDTRLLLRFFF